MAQRMITFQRVRSCEQSLRRERKVLDTIDELLRMDDLVPVVLHHTNLEQTVLKLLEKPKYREAALQLLKKIRGCQSPIQTNSSASSPAKLSSPQSIYDDMDCTFPAHLLSSSPDSSSDEYTDSSSSIDLVLPIFDAKLTMCMSEWLTEDDDFMDCIQNEEESSEFCALYPIGIQPLSS